MIFEISGSEYAESEKPAIEQLIKLGYSYKSQKELNNTRKSFNDPLLLDKLEESILKLNPWIDEEGVDEVIRQLKNFETNVAIDANEIVHAKIIGLSRKHLQPITIRQDLGDGSRPHTVKLIDFDNVENNNFIVTNQFVLWGHKDNIYPDIVLFVNGIPFVVIECKSPFISNPIHEAISNNITRYQLPNTGFEQLFYYNQIVVATCGTQAQYSTSYSDENQYREWKESLPFTNEQVQEKFGRSRKQEILIAGMFEKSNLLNLIRNFIVFESSQNKRIKKIAKYQQFRAVQKAIERIEQGQNSTEKGGVIWHTQGSGKSLTMVWLALQIKRRFGNPTLLVVTDRRQLDRQIHDTFVSCGFPNPIQASGKEDLKSLLENNKGMTIMTTIFKFPFFKEEKPHAISEEPIFVLVDEGHRSQYGVTHADMRAALPNAIFLAFTGTPLLKNSKTQRVFGDYIDTYKITESEEDGATIPIYYESRLAELHVEGESINKAYERITKEYDQETKELAKKKYANATAIASSPDRIKKICDDILDHYENYVKPNGLKAMIVAPSRKAAVIYKETLDKLGGPESKIIMTSMPQDKKYGWDKYELTQADKERFAERFKLSLDEDNLSILIVVDMLLTGFDAPILQVLYLDQGIKEHNLLQAIARVNRPYNEKKKHGLIIDYWGISKNLRDAFELYDSTDIQDIIAPLDDAKSQLQLRHAKVMSHFSTVNKNDWDAILTLLTPIDKREEFEYDFKQFSKYMDMVLPDPDAIKYRSDLSFLAKTRAAIRTAFIDENLDLRELGEKVKKLIEESIKSEETIRLIPPTKIDRINFLKLVDSYKSNKVKASIVVAKVRKILSDNEDKNPVLYKTLREELEDIISELEKQKYEDAKTVKKLIDFFTDIDEKTIAQSQGFTDEALFAIYLILTKSFEPTKAKELAVTIYKKIQPLMVLGWKKYEHDQIKIRNTIKDILRENGMDDFDIAQNTSQEILGILKARTK